MAHPNCRRALAVSLGLQRSGYWLADFIRIETTVYAEGKRRSPADVLKNLENYIQQFNAGVEIANEMIEMHPDLLTMPKAEPAAPEPQEPAPSPQVAPDKLSETVTTAPRNQTQQHRPRKGKTAA